MAKNQTAIPDDGVELETKKKVQERKFSLETLRGNCVKLFGCTSSTFDGAFFYADSTCEYTVAEAKAVIHKWERKGIGK
ncbi:MAG: hypothetical protein HFI82_10610 [Eubacterium sp.]|jgi:hypothetical protein|nr:hypothetical protein [Eubacterium sp.]